MKKIVIEILEMKGCPECYTLIKRVNEIVEELKDFKDYIEVVILDLFEHNKRVNELGMYQCPALAINGELQYLGIIPLKTELKNLLISYLFSS